MREAKEGGEQSEEEREEGRGRGEEKRGEAGRGERSGERRRAERREMRRVEGGEWAPRERSRRHSTEERGEERRGRHVSRRAAALDLSDWAGRGRGSLGHIAQWLERLAADQQVLASSPGVPLLATCAALRRQSGLRGRERERERSDER